MGLINHDNAVSSIASDRLYRGWDAIRVGSSENLAAVADIRVAVGAVEVTALGADTALAVAPMVVTADRSGQPHFNASAAPEATSARLTSR
jgi:hypothetical protein